MKVALLGRTHSLVLFFLVLLSASSTAFSNRELEDEGEFPDSDSYPESRVGSRFGQLLGADFVGDDGHFQLDLFNDLAYSFQLADAKGSAPESLAKTGQEGGTSIVMVPVTNTFGSFAVAGGASGGLEGEDVVFAENIVPSNRASNRGPEEIVIFEETPGPLGSLGYDSNNRDSNGNLRLRAKISDADSGMIYEIKPDADGEMFVIERNQADFPPELDGWHPDDHEHSMTDGDSAGKRRLSAVSNRTASTNWAFDSEERVDSITARSTESNQMLRGQSQRMVLAGTPDDSGKNLDLMVVWTKKAECNNARQGTGCNVNAGTEAAMSATIALAIAETNQAYADSGINTELRLVHEYRDETYVESSASAFSRALNDITGTTDGVMDDVHTKREFWGADIVALIIDDSQYCGIAWVGPRKQNMFSVTDWGCATGYYSFGHEIGHNQGCLHDRGTSNQCVSSHPNSYNFGYRDPTGTYRTILSYNCVSGQCDNNPGGGCGRAPVFSGPDNTFNGYQMGDAQNDNRRQINEVSAEIAGYFPVSSSTISCEDYTDCKFQPLCSRQCIEKKCNYSCSTEAPTESPSMAPSISMSPTVSPSSMRELETTKRGGNGSWGNLFNIEALKDAFIDTFYVHDGATNEQVSYEVWMKNDASGYNLSGESSEWTKVCDSTFVSSGRGQLSQIPVADCDTIEMEKGNTYGFYVTKTGSIGRALGIRYTNGSREGNVFTENADMKIYEGRGVGGSFFGGHSTFSPRVWNGIVRYRLAPEIVPTHAPSHSPSIQASAAPSIKKTLSPTVAPSNTRSEKPSAAPSAAPTVEHSATPSTESSSTPTIMASETPTIERSLTPSVTASFKPSKSPTTDSPTASIPDEGFIISLNPNFEPLLVGDPVPGIPQTGNITISSTSDLNVMIWSDAIDYNDMRRKRITARLVTGGGTRMRANTILTNNNDGSFTGSLSMPGIPGTAELRLQILDFSMVRVKYKVQNIILAPSATARSASAESVWTVVTGDDDWESDDFQ